LASRGKRGKPSRAAAFGGASVDRARAFPAALRILVLSALLLLAVYTAFSALRLKQGLGGTDAGLSAGAALLASRADVEAAKLRTALAAGAERLQQAPDDPIEAAEAALRLGRPAVRAVAVVGDDGLRAVAGAQSLGRQTLRWREAAADAGRSGRNFWIGKAGGQTPLAYAALPVEAKGERLRLVAATDFTALVGGGSETSPAVLATASGEILAASGLPADAPTLEAAVGLKPQAAVAAAGKDGAAGRLADRTTVSLATAAAADGAMLAVAARPTGGPAANKAVTDGMFALLAPLAVGLVLSLVLMRQSRKIEAAQVAHAAAEQKFRLAVEAARCGIWEWRLDEDTVAMSDVTGVMLGWGGGGAARGDEVIARIAPEHQARVRDALESARKYGAFDVSFRVPGTKGSAWIDARGQAVDADGAGVATAIIGVALDVTEERMTEARAQAAEGRLRDAIEAVSEAFVLWDRRGRLVIWNNSYREYFALDQRVLRRGASRELVQKVADISIRSSSPAPRGRGMREAELMDGRWVQISERRTAEGGLVMTAVDITAIKRQEETRRQNEEALQRAVDRLEESQRELTELAQKYEQEKTRAEGANRAKSDFLANMSHELRTPLNAIIGFSEMMTSEIYGPMGSPRYGEYAQDILASGQHLLAVINDILDMSKIEAGKMSLHFQAVDLLDVAEDAVRFVRAKAEEAGLRLECDVSSKLPEVRADYRALKQILLNLLSNAVKFTPRGGHVSLTAAVVGDEGQERVRIEVRDTGIGISKEDLARLAKPFEQVETQFAKTQQGTGLGLALVKSLVEMHSGQFTIESEPGHGVAAAFTLPTKAAFREEPGAASAVA
jgi:two-component system cell cycle sensor histidine kinase PleC